MLTGKIFMKRTALWCLSLVLVASTAHAVQVELISGVAPGGPSATAESILDVLSELSGDGRYALFLSSAGNVIPGQFRSAADQRRRQFRRVRERSDQSRHRPE